MRRVVKWLCALGLLSSNLFAQTTNKTVLQNSNVQAFASNVPAVTSPTIGKNEDLTIHNLRDYEYTLEPEKDKEYKKYQAVKLDGVSSQELIVGLLTHSLERENRYIEIGAGRIALVRQILDQSDVSYVFLSPFEKEYFIAGDGTYRYIDGKELAGSKRVKTYLQKGKPVTVTTFYFALRNKGLISKEIDVRTFISMSVEEQIAMLGLTLYAQSN